MPTFDTPSPIDLAVNIQVGDIDVVAVDRTDTVVTVTPSNEAKAADRRAAEATRVKFDGTRLTVIGPRARFGFLGSRESVDLTVELPAGSRFTAEISVGAVRTTGRLGSTRIKNSTGAVELSSTGDLWLHAGHGNATVGVVGGSAEITVDYGQLRLESLAGDAILKASYGSIRIEESLGNLEANLSYGDLDIERALASVTAKTAYGAISLHEVSGGSIQADSDYGQVTVGVRPDTPAWLDLSSKQGRVRNQLESEQAPADSEASVAVRVRTKFGDIDIRRAR